jgi:hypothetical protein
MNSAQVSPVNAPSLAVLFALLAEHGWTESEESRHAATKDFDTAVGVKEAIAYVRAWKEGPTAFTLSASYTSEGRNTLGMLHDLVPKAASEDEVRRIVAKFSAEVDRLVGETYAMRLKKIGVGSDGG